IVGYGTIGADASVNNDNNVYEYRDDLSRQIGNHSLKAGFEFLRIQKFDRYIYANHQGTFTFNGTATGNPLADLLLGDAFEYTEQSFIPNPYLFASDYEFYVQDDWKLRPSLTVNIGLRDEVMAGAPNGRSKYNTISDFIPGLYDPSKAPTVKANGQLVAGTGDPLNGIITPTNQKGLRLPPSLKQTHFEWGPRFGFAWSPFGNQKTVLRGGYGIFYHWDNDSQENLSQNPPFSNSASIFNTGLSNPAGGTAALFPPNLTTEDVRFLYPMVQQYSVTLERAVPGATVISIGYVGNRAVHLDQSFSFAFNYVYDLPFFKAQQGVLGRVLGRWEWSGITTYAAGYPFTVTETGNRSGTGNAGRPNVVGPLYVEPGNVARYFNTAAFAPQPLGQFGNAGRDILRGPGLGVWNMSLYKNTPFQLGGREITLRFGGDGFT